MKDKVIIGTTGTLLSGKNTVNDYLVKKYHFINFTCSDEIREVVKSRGITEDRDVLIKVANEMRNQDGNGVIGKMIAKKIIDQNISRASIDGLRHPDEVSELKKAGDFHLIKVDAPVEIRFERNKTRGTLKDGVTLEKFKEQERYEMANQDEYSQQTRATMALADFSIMNDGTLEELYQKIENILKELNL